MFNAMIKVSWRQTMATDGGLNAITVKMYICILEVSLNRPLDYVCLSSSYCKLVPCQRVTSEAMSVVTINNGLLIFDIRRYRASPNPLSLLFREGNLWFKCTQFLWRQLSFCHSSIFPVEDSIKAGQIFSDSLSKGSPRAIISLLIVT